MTNSRLNALHSWVAFRATPRILAGGVLLWLAFVLGVVALQSRVAKLTDGLAVPDVMLFYTPRELHALLEQYGSVGRSAFLDFTLYDIFYPLVAYGVAVMAVVNLSRDAIQSHPWLKWLLVVPLAGLTVELLEQACFLGILALFPTRVPALAAAASVLTLGKFTLITALVVSVVLLGLWRLGRRAA